MVVVVFLVMVFIVLVVVMVMMVWIMDCVGGCINVVLVVVVLLMFDYFDEMVWYGFGFDEMV